MKEDWRSCAFVAEAPLRGHSRPDLTTRPLRFWTLTRYPNAAIVYRPDSASFEVVAVLRASHPDQFPPHSQIDFIFQRCASVILACPPVE
jgi:hypothetical protein